VWRRYLSFSCVKVNPCKQTRRNLRGKSAAGNELENESHDFQVMKNNTFSFSR